MNKLVRRAIGEAGPERSSERVDGFVAVQPDGTFYTGQHPGSVAFSTHRGILERALPPGIASVVPATLVVHHEHSRPVA